jgi:hypothetical protein
VAGARALLSRDGRHARHDWPYTVRREGKEGLISSNDVLDLANGHLRIQVNQERQGYTGYSLSVRATQHWHKLGTGRFGRLAYLTKDGERRATNVTLSTATLGEDFLRIGGEWTDTDGLSWTLSHEFRLDANPHHVVVTVEAIPSGPIRLLHLSGPTMLAGDGAFGARKTDAIFPGLEYLGPDEPSSSTRFASATYAARWSPHPYKVAIPLMAVSHDGLAVGLLWDPNQVYCSAWRHPTPVFDSPNPGDGADHHLLGLFAPGVPRFVEENATEAVRPFEVGAQVPIRLQARLVALAEATSIDVLKEWVEINGFPEPHPPASYRENVDLCVRSYLDIAWDDVAEGWHHTLADPWGPRYEPRVIAQLWRYGQWDEGQSELQQRARDQVRRGVQRARLSGAGPENPQYQAVVPHIALALHYGLLTESLTGTELQVRELITTQAADGSWPWTRELIQHAGYDTDERRTVMGGTDSSTGLTADRAHQVLHWARITGDPVARDAGLRAVAWCNAQTRPEGAQTWELHLHVPDILAVPYLIDCNLDAFALTHDETYLAEADRWAWTGLPFTYLWRAYYRPIMAYCTVPVFGVTFHDVQSWFGVDVHWNGLVYADALLRLAATGGGERWRNLAVGIVACGMHQQPTEGPWLGMYPDAFSLVRGEEEYTWWLNPNLIGLNTFELAGLPLDHEPRLVTRDGGESVHVTSAAEVHHASWQADTLQLTLAYPIGEASRTLIARVDRPAWVRVNDDEVSEAGALDDVETGWQWLPNLGMLIVKAPHTSELVRLDVVIA